MNTKLIYTLSCPFTDEVHYVGKTTMGMTRPLSHLSNSHSEKIRIWVDELKVLGDKPVVKIIDNISSVEDLDYKERYWIQYYMNKGNLLLNTNIITPLTISANIDELLGSENFGIQRISEFIKKKRRTSGLKQEEFAQKSGIALTVIRKIEQGKSNITLDSLLSILKMFGMSIDVYRPK
tara:strand:+ start:98 stop:634 length:537 start_codon:yes stop_codon:yes gene_type:complete